MAYRPIASPPDRRRSGPRPKSEKQQAKERERIARERFRTAKIAERDYTRALTAVGRQVGLIIKGFTHDNPLGSYFEMDQALKAYSDLIGPWAHKVTARMHAEIGWRDLRSWTQLSKSIGRSLTLELATAPTGAAFHKLMREQVTLIKSLPLEAGLRVHELTKEAIVGGRRFEEIVPEIWASGEITVNRARLIARTETARTGSVLTQTRAEHVGSDAYIWRTAEDEAVRPDHRDLNGKVFKWSEPPISNKANGARSHPGQIYNCRCYPQPILS
jgi:SPP1 gp7 family putative phage head morphogenesis protein